MINPSSKTTILAEEKLMKQLVSGDEKATRQVVSQNLDKVISIAIRITGNYQQAEDIAQEVFIKLFKQASIWQPKAKISTWLYRVTYNMSIDFVRSKKNHHYSLNEFILSAENKELNQDFSKEDILNLEDSLSSLSQQYRMALTLFYFNKKKIKEGAEIMSLSEDAFESLLRRARGKLKNKMKNYHGVNNETNKTNKTNKSEPRENRKNDVLPIIFFKQEII